eukprot:g4280.t1
MREPSSLVQSLLFLCWSIVSGLYRNLTSFVDALRLFFRGGERLDIGSRSVKVGRLIAEGGFSYVHIATDIKSPWEKYALKRSLAQSKEQLDSILQEIKCHRKFQHPNLLKLLGASRKSISGGERIDLLFPLCRGSMEDELNRMRDSDESVIAFSGKHPGFFSELEALKLFVQVCSGLSELHRQDPCWAHHDIKPANILFSPRDGSSPLLMDFGSASPARITVDSRAKALSLQEWAAQNCSMPYRAPELFDVKTNSQIDERTDIWSLGCTLFAALFGYSPFECEFFNGDDSPRGGGMQSKRTSPRTHCSSVERVRVVECSYLRVVNGLPPFPKNRSASISSDCCDLIRCMCTVDPTSRLFLSEALEKAHKLLKSSRSV